MYPCQLFHLFPFISTLIEFNALGENKIKFSEYFSLEKFYG